MGVKTNRYTLTTLITETGNKELPVCLEPREELDANGPWCLASDVQALEITIDELRQELVRLRGALN